MFEQLPPASVAMPLHTYGQYNIVLDDDTMKMSSFADQPDSHNRKYKIICTMDPSCWEGPLLDKLIENGMAIARLNFSHGDHESHAGTVERIRAAAARGLPRSRVVILPLTSSRSVMAGLSGGREKGWIRPGDRRSPPGNRRARAERRGPRPAAG